ncbi:hypothetical protein [Actinomycetospora aeridis]|uniref:LSDAT prokaryote domain-containing protein n=1 Tax=Actinomycetospora aeridis TaxID=3129231 RepID=A0ABU8MYE3_9PSEU
MRVADADGLAAALRDAGLAGGRPVVVLVGGAGGMDDAAVQLVADVLAAAVLPVLGDTGAVVDGGTDAGVMRAAGRAVRDHRAALVGVAAEGTVAPPAGSSTEDGAPAPERGHTHLLLVPGDEWGDESPWIDRVAAAIADGHPSVTVLANGGGIAAEDVERGLARGRPVVVLAGTGRLADEIAEGTTPRATNIARSALTTVLSVHDLGAVRAAVTAALRPSEGET